MIKLYTVQQKTTKSNKKGGILLYSILHKILFIYVIIIKISILVIII